MEYQEIIAILNKQFGIPIIETSHYWLIRTESGLYYDDFYTNNFVGIGWDYANVNTINTSSYDELKELIKNNENLGNKSEKAKKRECTSIANKLIRFVKEIKARDIIIIPSQNADKIAIGQIVDDNVYEDLTFHNKFANKSINICPFIKRRKVNWLKQQMKNDIDIYLFKLLSCHQAIYSANEYAEFICRTIYPIYISDKKLHVTLKAGHVNGLSVNELESLIDFIGLITQGTDKNSTEIKLNIHSPGIVEIISLILGSGASIALIIFALNHFINGGKTKMSLKTKNINFNVDSESKGILEHNLEKNEFELKKEVVEKYQKLHDDIQLEIPKMDTDEKVKEYKK